MLLLFPVARRPAVVNLEQLFQSVATVLAQNQAAFNQADPFNANHGDHMVEIFQVASQSAHERVGSDITDAMQYASQKLSGLTDNGSALMYAHGLSQVALQFRSYGVTLDDLVPYVQGLTKEEKSTTEDAAHAKSGDVLKALVAGLAGWQRVESGETSSNGRLDMGYLFELGMSYMQAKQRGGSRLEVLADAATSASPLAAVPHRYQSGKTALLALLQALGSA
jgi:hypothetical protein